jgi:hypothetical protein
MTNNQPSSLCLLRPCRPGSRTWATQVVGFLGSFNAEQPPSILLVCRSGLTFKINLHLLAGIGRYFEPVLAHILLAAAMMARAGLPPRVYDLCNAYDLRSPPELLRQPRLPGRHPRRVDRFKDRLNRLAYEFLNHDITLNRPTYSTCLIPSKFSFA